jgi:hypothetical protein
MTIAPTSGFRYSKFIVSPTAGQGNYTTIQAAINAASNGDVIFIRTGQYTENLTLAAGVDLCAWPGDQADGNVTIVGTCTLTVATTVNISSIRLQTNSAALLAVTGSAASIINLNNCYLNCTNNTGITFSTSNAAGKINLNSCDGDIGTTGISLFTHTSAGTLNIQYGTFTNSGGSSTASTASAGALACAYCKFMFPITTSSTNVLNSFCNIIDSSAQNATSLTLGGTQGAAEGDNYASGSASAVSVGGALGVVESVVNSTNTNAITGAGSLSYDLIIFSGSSKVINTTTQATFNSTTFTPVLKFGGGTTGITYGNQYGKYYRVGNCVIFTIFIALTNKGSSTGSATITGLPFTSANDGGNYDYAVPIWNITAATATSCIADLPANSSTLSLFFLVEAAGTITALADTNFGNSSTVRFSGTYFI